MSKRVNAGDSSGASDPLGAAKGSVGTALLELKEASARIDWDAVEKAANLVLESGRKGGRVHVTGVGKPSHVASFVASSLSSTGTPAYFLDAVECLHGSSGQLRPDDVVIAISNSGATQELLLAVEHLKRRGIRVIGVSRDGGSSLAAASDVFLQARVEREGDALNLAPRISILAALMVLNALSVYLQEAGGLTPERFRDWHPGGRLGKPA